MEHAATAIHDDDTQVPALERLVSLRRRLRPALAVAASVLLLVVLVTFLWPATYRSQSVILIEQQEVPQDFVQSMITSYADQRVQLITQRVMTTENLLKIIEKFDLYAGWRKDRPREEVIERMREDIGMQMISADVVDPRVGRPVKATIAFSVHFDSSSADTAARVANELTSLYLNENIRSRTRLAEETSEFLNSEAARLSARLSELEQSLSVFKENNADDLPELTSMNLTLVNRAEDELRTVESRIQSLDEQAVLLDAQLAQINPTAMVYSESGERIMSPVDQLKMLRSQLAAAKARYQDGHPDVLRLTRQIEGLERQVGTADVSQDLVRQLADAETRLAVARDRYTPDHPDVRRYEALVAGIRQAMEEDTGTAAELSARENPDNPAYIQLMTQRRSIDIDRQAMLNRRVELQSRVRELEGRIARTPAVEKDYAGLVRDLQGTRAKYDQVRQKQLEAQVAENMEAQRMGERFTLIEPPLRPEKPESPNRPLLLILGLLAALGSGAVVALVLDAVDSSVRGRADLARMLDVEPLSVIPWIDTEADRRRAVKQRRMLLASGAVATVAVVLGLHLFWRPLDLVWFVAMRKLGL